MHVDTVYSLGMLRCGAGQQCFSPFGSGWKDKLSSFRSGACCHCWVFVLALNPAAVVWDVAQGVCTWGTCLGNQFQHCCLPFLKSGFIFLKRAPKPGCGWPSCDSIWGAKLFLAFPFAESSPPAVSPLSALAVLKPRPFPPWPSSGAWSCSSGEPLHDGEPFLFLILNGHKAKLNLVLKEVMSNKFRQILKGNGFVHVPALFIASFTTADEASN